MGESLDDSAFGGTSYHRPVGDYSHQWRRSKATRSGAVDQLITERSGTGRRGVKALAITRRMPSWQVHAINIPATWPTLMVWYSGEELKMGARWWFKKQTRFLLAPYRRFRGREPRIGHKIRVSIPIAHERYRKNENKRWVPRKESPCRPLHIGTGSAT